MTEHWLSSGEIIYEDVSARYDLSQECVLQDVSFSAKPRERVGIVGRTGVGKSSLVLTLVRGLEIESGQIFIDGVDTRLIDLQTLRRGLAIIPQGPILFAETLRFNLDPLSEHSDEELIEAVKKVGLLDYTDNNDSGELLHNLLYDLPHSPDDLKVSSVSRNRFDNLLFVLAESGSNIS